jgi:hypothetical protein
MDMHFGVYLGDQIAFARTSGATPASTVCRKVRELLL